MLALINSTRHMKIFHPQFSYNIWFHADVERKRKLRIHLIVSQKPHINLKNERLLSWPDHYKVLQPIKPWQTLWLRILRFYKWWFNSCAHQKWVIYIYMTLTRGTKWALGHVWNRPRCWFNSSTHLAKYKALTVNIHIWKNLLFWVCFCG